MKKYDVKALRQLSRLVLDTVWGFNSFSFDNAREFRKPWHAEYSDHRGLLVSIYSYSTLMDRSSNAIRIEALKSIGGLFIIYSTRDWFGIDQLVLMGSSLVAGYLIASIFIVAYSFLSNSRKKIKLPLLSFTLLR